jgi:arylsulfatase
LARAWNELPARHDGAAYAGRGPLAAALATALLTGGVDALLALAANPDPGDAGYRLGYALGPLLVAVGWAIPVALLAVGVLRGRGGADAVAAGAVAAVWGGSLVLDAWRAGHRGVGIVLVTAGLGIAALALARLGRDAGRRLAAAPRAWRRAVVVGGVAVLALATAAVLPAAFDSFRGGGGPCPAGSAVPAGPSILLVTVDALRADAARDMASYRRLAAAGVELRRHVSPSPWTLPALASVLTGLAPEVHGAGRSLSARSPIAKSAVPPALPTVAHALGAQGWRTHAVVTNPYLTARYGIDRGFCTFDNVTMDGEAVRGLGQTVPVRLVRALAPGRLPSDRADVVRARAERWLAAADERPFFLWLHFLDPHAPYGDRDGESTSLVHDLMALQGPAGLGAPFRGVGLVRAGEYRPGPDDRRRIEDLYRQDVAWADREIVRLLDFLDARGLRARTAIVFTADHGEEFWDHGGIEHGRTLYEEVLHVPLVIVPPQAAPAIRDELTTAVDLAPTIAALAGIPAAREWTGVDLLGTRVPDRRIALGNLLFGEEWSGVRTPGWKYMRSEFADERLYDLAGDPGERVNTIATQPDVVRSLRAALPGSAPATRTASGAR